MSDMTDSPAPVSVASRRSTPDCLSEENWFHGRISREQAETVLRTAGYSEGLFLVRESQSCPQVSCGWWRLGHVTSQYSPLIGPQDFVLCVVHNNAVIHYQVSCDWSL